MRAKVLGFIRQRKRILLAAGIAVVSSYLILSFIFSDLGVVKYISMKREYDRIRDEISRLDTENKRLKGDVESLKTDPDSIEALARERLGLVKEGELIYRFQDKNKDK